MESLDQMKSVSLSVCRMFCGPQVGTLWPYPTGPVKVGNSLYHFDVNKMVFGPIAPAKLQGLWTEVQERFRQQVIKKVPKHYTLKAEGKKVSFEFAVQSDDVYYTMATDESYKLAVSEVRDGVHVVISAPTFFGARHALETLAQLIVFDDIRSEMLVRIVLQEIYFHTEVIITSFSNPARPVK